MPTRIAFSDTDIRKIDNDLSVSQRINERSFFLPWFKHFWPEVIKQYADAFKKVIYHYDELLPGDKGNIAT